MIEFRISSAEGYLKSLESDLHTRKVWKKRTPRHPGIDEAILFYEKNIAEQKEELAKRQNDLKENQESIKIFKDRMLKYEEQLKQVEKERSEWIK